MFHDSGTNLSPFLFLNSHGSGGYSAMVMTSVVPLTHIL
jgi:hypothetical protein